MNRKRVLILVIALLSVCELSAQHYVGVKGGINGGSIRMKPSVETQTVWGLPAFGLFYQYRGGDKFFGGIEVGLNYTQKGYATLPRVESDTSYQRRVNSVELPFLWHPHINIFKKRGTIFFNVGPYLAYHLSSSEQVVSKSNGVLESGSYQWNPAADNRMEYGLMGGGGFSLSITKKVELFSEFRFTWGFSDIMKNGTKYKGNPQESPLSMMGVFFGASYRLGRSTVDKKIFVPASQIPHQEPLQDKDYKE